MIANQHAELGPTELKALRRIAGGFVKIVSQADKDALLSMGLIILDKQGRLVLTGPGKDRLASKGDVALTAPVPPSFVRLHR